MTSDSPNTADIVERLLATHSRVSERPTIAELEAILSAPSAAPVEIMPNGEIKDAGGLINPDGPEAAALIKELRELLYESLYHLRIDEAAAAYHVRAAAVALKGHKNAKAMKARATLAKVTKP